MNVFAFPVPDMTQNCLTVTIKKQIIFTKGKNLYEQRK